MWRIFIQLLSLSIFYFIFKNIGHPFKIVGDIWSLSLYLSVCLSLSIYLYFFFATFWTRIAVCYVMRENRRQPSPHFSVDPLWICFRHLLVRLTLARKSHGTLFWLAPFFLQFSSVGGLWAEREICVVVLKPVSCPFFRSSFMSYIDALYASAKFPRTHRNPLAKRKRWCSSTMWNI